MKLSVWLHEYSMELPTMIYFFIIGFALIGYFPQVQAEEKTIFKSTEDAASESAKLKAPENITTTLSLNTPINDAKVYFSYSMEIHSSKKMTSEDLVLDLFLIEPNGNIKKTPTPQFTLNEGKNIGAFNDVFVLVNPLKGNYVIGCLAHFNSPTDTSISFTGTITAILKRPSRTEKFTSMQIPKLNISGPDFITLSTHIVLLDTNSEK